MIICTRCKYRNEDDDEFCGSCGKLLEWVGEQVVVPVEPPVEEPADVVPEPGRPGIITRVKAAVGIEDAPAAPGTTPLPPDQPTQGDGSTDDALRAAADEEARLAAEARRAAAADEEARLAAEAEQAHLAAEAEARRAAAAEEARVAAEAETARRAVVAGEARVAAAAEEARRAAAEAEAGRRAAEAEQAVRLAETARRQAADDAAELETAQRAAEAEAAARRAADEARRAKEEEEARRAAAEEAALLVAEAESARRAAAEQAARRAAEEEEARRAEEEARRVAMAKLLARPQARPVRPEPVRPVPAPATQPSPGPTRGPAPPSVPVEPVATSTSTRAYEPEKRPTPLPRPLQQPASEERVIREGDLICGKCGRGNDPERNFCRKCGTPLLEAEIAERPPWWKRIFRRRKRVYKAGDRPGRSTRGSTQGARRSARSISFALRRLLLLLAVVGIALPIAVPSARRVVREKVTALRKAIVPRFENVQPIGVDATSESPEHEPFLMTDRTKNTFWSEASEGDGVGERITFTFDGTVDLDKMVIRSGAFDENDPGLFESKPRPAKINVVLDNGKSFEFALKNEPGDQVFTLKRAKQVASLELSILTVHRSAGGTDMSISQVEFQKIT